MHLEGKPFLQNEILLIQMTSSLTRIICMLLYYVCNRSVCRGMGLVKKRGHASCEDTVINAGVVG
jgi:hypothetical protein